MDRIYRPQRWIYDATRRFFLPGRDELLRGIARLPAASGARFSVLEVGCGTGRNLFWLSRRRPSARLCGVDVSREMLKTARERLARRSGTISLAAGEAAALGRIPQVREMAPFDAILFSYSLSMMPEWRKAVASSLALLRQGGSLHLVDFDGLGRWPPPFRSLLRWWLARWHVHGVPEAVELLHKAAGAREGQVSVRRLAGGYAFLARMSCAGGKPAGRFSPQEREDFV